MSVNVGDDDRDGDDDGDGDVGGDYRVHLVIKSMERRIEDDDGRVHSVLRTEGQDGGVSFPHYLVGAADSSGRQM